MRSSWKPQAVRDLIIDHYSGPSPTCEERWVRDGEWGLLKTTAVTWDRGWDWHQHKVPPRAYWGQNQIEVRPDDVLVTKAGPRHRVGVVAHVDATPPRLMASGKMVGLRPNPRMVLPRILAELLSLSGNQRFLDQRTTGMAESQVNFANETLLGATLAIPPLSEQHDIADLLQTIDTAIAGTSRLLTKLGRLAQGLRAALLTRGVDEDGRIRDPDRTPQAFRNSPAGQIPGSWKESTLGNEFTLQRGFDITVAQQRPGTVPVVSSSGITSFHDTAMVAGPGVVTGRKGKLGGSYFIREAFWPHDTTLWVKDFHGNDPRFAALFLGAFGLERFDAATSVPTLNRNFVHPLPVAIPQVDEQRRIVAAMDVIQNHCSAERRLLTKFRLLRGGLAEALLDPDAFGTDRQEGGCA